MIEQKELSVKDTALETGLSEHTLRYYEKIGLIDPIKRSESGHRCYSRDDIGWIEFLKCLRSTGMPIETMKQYIDFQRIGDDSFDQRLNILKNHKSTVLEKIKELNRYLSTIDYKINYYSQTREKKN